MVFNRILLGCISILVCYTLQAQRMNIGIFRDYSIKRVLFAYNDGSYSVYADTTFLGVMAQNDFFDLSVEKGKVRVKKGVTDLGAFNKVIFIQDTVETSISITPKTPVVKQRKYEEDFEVFVKSSTLTVVNVIDMDNYLSGVVESEGGSGKPIEYYKVQALMSRTFALKHRGRHKSDGFDLCDRVHCQAYHNMLRFNPSIDTAVHATHDEVMEDLYGNLISTFFHANCGGQTCEPEHIWNDDLHYLNTFVDTFCIYTKQAKWEKRVPKSKWRSYLVDTFNYPEYDSTFASMMYTFDQPQRMAFYISPVFGIPLYRLREQFDLKSTYFSCYPEGADVVIKGRGYGHGVGLCQEGAMKMAKLGYNYRQIAHYYFPDTRLVDYSRQLYFRQRASGL